MRIVVTDAMVDAGLRAAYEDCAAKGEMGPTPDSWEEICRATDADPELSEMRDGARQEARVVIEGALNAYEG